MNNTIETEWQTYFKGCYPQGAHSQQEIETRQAFFAGALTVLKLQFNRIGSQAEFDRFMESVKTEILAVHTQRLNQMKRRN